MQVMGSSDSLSVPSEPPDIRNWFSSYVYESPALDSLDFEYCFASGGIEDSRKTLEGKRWSLDEIGNANEVKKSTLDERAPPNAVSTCENGFEDCRPTNEVDDSQNSLFSEPPDLKNWFSSYTYESPALDSSEDLIFSDDNELKVEAGNLGNCSCKEHVFKDCKETGKNKHSPTYRTSDIHIKCFNLVRDDHYSFKDAHKAEASGKKSLLEDLPHENVPESILVIKKMENSDSFKRIESLMPKDGSSFCHSRKSSDKESSHELLKEYSTKSDKESSHELLKECSTKSGKSRAVTFFKQDASRKSFKAEDCKENSVSLKANRDITTCCHQDENNKDEFVENGFISTRSRVRRVGVENSFMCSTIQTNKLQTSSAGNEDTTIRRKVLSETTNFDHPDIVGFTGKWRCPQKSKPSLGPPMKQLRLEQWLRRV